MKQINIPKIQQDLGLGIIECPRCGGSNYKGNYMCAHDKCTQRLPGFVVNRSDVTYSSGNGVDMDKIESKDVEFIAQNRNDARKMYQGAADKIMDAIDHRLKHATSEKEVSELRERKQNLGIRFYNRHYGTNFKN